MSSFSFILAAFCCFLAIQYSHTAAPAICPRGWLTLDPGHGEAKACYKLYSNQKKNYNAAVNFCKQQGGYLATDQTVNMHNKLKNYIKNAGKSGPKPQYFWIGLSDNNQDRWTWSNGVALGRWQLWRGNHTLIKNKMDCVYVATGDNQVKWQRSANCGSLKAVVCQRNTGSTAKPTTQRPRMTCAGGWKMYNRNPTCVKLFTQQKSWLDARTACQQQGGDLVKIADGGMSGFVNGLVNRQKGNYWIGLHDRHKENMFEWLDEDTKATFTYWADKQPDNAAGTENCVEIRQPFGFKWNDNRCELKMRYICQRATVQNTSPATSPATPASRNCGAGWEDDPNTDNCYQINEERLSWLDARQACITNGGDLASIRSVQEQFYLSARSLSFDADFLWVGANDRGTETGWMWANKAPMAFLNWAAREPNNAHNSDCVAMTTKTGRWNDLPCQTRYGYICEKKGRQTTPTPRPTTSPAKLPNDKMWGCPLGWRGFRGSCYLVLRSPGGLSWSTAKSVCGARLSNLVTITDDAENKFVYSLLPKNQNQYVWIGMNDLAMENSFMWDDNSPVTYTNWSPHEPNNIHNEDCTAMYSKTGKWNDANCNTKAHFMVCKQNKAIHAKAEREIVKGCKSGIGYEAQCYTFVPQNKNWNDAQNFCKGKGGNLATVNNRHVQAFLAAEMQPFGAAWWIGLSRTVKTGYNYTWATPYDLTYTNWDKSHTGNENNTCVGMRTSRPIGLWMNYPCTKAQGFVCEAPRNGFTTPPPTTTTTVKLLCPTGWFTYGRLCYKAYNMSADTMLTWNDARDYCNSLDAGGDLATMINRGHENWLFRTAFKNMVGYVWIGLSDKSLEGGYKWNDGRAWRYTNWAPDEPNDMGGKEDCVQMNLALKKWNDAACYIPSNFICQVPKGAVITTPKPVPTGKPSTQCGNSSWTEYQNSCYFMSPTDGDDVTKTWFEANLICQDMGANLVSITSDDENAFVTGAIARHPGNVFWTGLNDLDQDTLKWTDGSPLTYVSWADGQPDDYFGSERCVEMNDYAFWNDQHCQEKRAYICEKRPGDYTKITQTTASSKGGCPAGYHTLPTLTKCFKIGGTDPRQRKNFTDAMTICNQLTYKSRLASIHNPTEEKFISVLLANSKIRWPAWIGFNDRIHRNSFVWVDNSINDFTYWGSRQPDENLKDNRLVARKDCVDMELGGNNAGKWYDKRCQDRYAFVCEIPKGTIFPTEPTNTTGCKAGYTRFRDSCYKYNNDLYTWQQAEQMCNLDAGHLVSLQDRFEMYYIELMTLGKDPDLMMWLGMNYDLVSGQYVWSDTWPVKYTNWGKGEPNRMANEGCVSHTVDGSWQDVPCQMQLTFVCEINLVQAPTSRPASTAKCQKGWVQSGDYCFQLERTNLKSWSGARYACSILGGSLASVHTDTEAKFLTQQITRGRLDTWIGMSKGQGMGFSWSDNTPVNYLYWSQGEPSDSNSALHQDCVVASKQDGSWRDTDCSDQHAYICKLSLYPGRSTVVTIDPNAVVTIPDGAGPTQYPPVNPQTPYNPYNPQTPYNPYNPQTPYNPGQNTPYNPGRNTPFNPGQNTPYNPGQYTPYRPYQTYPPYTQGPPVNPQGLQGNTNLSTGGLSGGAVAGLVLGAIAIIAAAVVAVFYFRRNGIPGRAGISSPSAGFDNATYSSGGGQVKLSSDA